MSNCNRKIGYYTFQFVKGDDETRFFDSELFCNLLNYINSIPDAERIHNDARHSKAKELCSLDEVSIQGKHLLKIIFKSCKYNHSPDLMSSRDGTERSSDKKEYEGEKELTHLCIEVNSSEAFSILEERASGVTISQITTYFNIWMEKYSEQNESAKETKILFNIVPSDDFINSLRRVRRITIAELHTEKALLGSGFLNLLELTDDTQDDVVMQIKAKRKRNLSKESIQKLYSRMSAEEIKVNRIRIYGRDEQGLNVLLDSLNAKKKEEITVNLTEKGIVDSFSMFSKMEELMGVTV